jgi:hypothetical protein
MPVDIRDYLARVHASPDQRNVGTAERPAERGPEQRIVRRRVIHDTSDDDEGDQQVAVPAPPAVVVVLDSSSDTDNILDLRRDSPPRRRGVRPRSADHSRFEGEAEEGSDSGSSSAADTDGDESDAAAEYRAAVMSVRNRRTAVHHVRAGTTRCAVCRKFAKFLALFQ